jgi:uncharacterized protein YegP (UPF0339 family)
MSKSPTRLGALVGKWDVPGPTGLKKLLQPEPEVERRFYESNLPSSSEKNSSEQDPSSGNRADDRDSQRGRAGAEFEICRTESGEFRWRLLTEDGDVLAASGSQYPSRSACRRAIDQVRALGPNASVKEQP